MLQKQEAGEFEEDTLEQGKCSTAGSWTHRDTLGGGVVCSQFPSVQPAFIKYLLRVRAVGGECKPLPQAAQRLRTDR